jgi:hypothetical protein
MHLFKSTVKAGGASPRDKTVRGWRGDALTR